MILSDPIVAYSDQYIPTVISPDPSQHDASLIILFFVLQLIGLVGSILTIVIAHFSPIRRHLTWYNFLASWIISSLSYSLLLFAGQIDISGETESEVPFGLCVFQSSVIYASPPLSAATMLGMVAQIWFSVHLMLFKRPMIAQKLLTRIVLILPYMLFLGISTEALVFGLMYPDSVRVTGSGMYCNSGLGIPLSLFFFFTIHHGAALNIVIAFIPVMAVFTFASQKDLLEVWMFRKWWKKGSSAVFVHPRAMAESNSTLRSPVSVYDEKDLPPLPA
ncbi:hypothetical protein EV359DRAFT_83669 [Lentinula novae-zelandiae]|nr:hypothetical protein EV359DRAFT_83669 [Lentinula novae-zelandiae]